VAGCEINDDPFRPLCKRCRDLVAEMGEATPVGWLSPDRRYVEKLATRTSRSPTSSATWTRSGPPGAGSTRERADHALRLLPRAHRGIFALNELPTSPAHPGRPLQHPPGGGRADQGLPGAAAHRRLHGLHRQPRGLHRSGQDHHPAQGSDRERDPDPLPDDARARRRESPPRRRGRRGGRTSWSRATCARWWRASPSPPAGTRRSTAGAGSRSACPSPPSRTRSATPSGAPSSRARRPSSPASPTSTAALPLAHREVRAGVEGSSSRGERWPGAHSGRRSGGVRRRTSARSGFRQVVRFFEEGGTLRIREGSSSEEVLGQLQRVPEALENTDALGSSRATPRPSSPPAGEFRARGTVAQKKIGRSDDRGFVAPERRSEPELTSSASSGCGS